MSPWLFFLAPMIAIIFPWTIPFIILIGIYQWSEDGTKPRTLIEAHRRWNEPEPPKAPLLSGEELAEQLQILIDQRAKAEPAPVRNIGTCPACSSTIARVGKRWQHTTFDALCPETNPTPMEGVAL